MSWWWLGLLPLIWGGCKLGGGWLKFPRTTCGKAADTGAGSAADTGVGRTVADTGAGRVADTGAGREADTGAGSVVDVADEGGGVVVVAGWAADTGVGKEEKLLARLTMFSRKPGWKLDRMSWILLLVGVAPAIGAAAASDAPAFSATACGGDDAAFITPGQGSAEKSLRESSGFSAWRSIWGMGRGLESLLAAGSGSLGSSGSLLSKKSGRRTVLSRASCTLFSCKTKMDCPRVCMCVRVFVHAQLCVCMCKQGCVCLLERGGCECVVCIIYAL